MPSWSSICGGCAKAVTAIDGVLHCTTPGCSMQTLNLPTSKTGLSSPNYPIVDPAVTRETRDLERSLGWTPALPFTECTCWDDYDRPLKVPPHLDSCPQSPLYDPDRCTECGNVGLHKMSCGSKNGGPWEMPEMPEIKQYTDFQTLSTLSTLSEATLTAKPFACPLCWSIAKHADSCPAQPGHSCSLCGKPIYHVTFSDGSQGWRHDKPTEDCTYAATPKATKLTGTCTHGNPLVYGCQACQA